MKKNEIIISEDRSILSISGADAKDFLQNILTNDIDKVDENNSIFSAIFTPQGKYMYEFFVIKNKDKYFLECTTEFAEDLISYLSKYKLRSNIQIHNESSLFAVAIISLDKFEEIKESEKIKGNTALYRESTFFIDPRNINLGVRVISNLEKLYLTIKKLNLKIIDDSEYLKKAHSLGIPIKGTKYLKDQLFGLEANFEELGAIDFKKGCYVGQENTARMKLKNKIRRKLMPIISQSKIEIGSEINFNKSNIGKVLINNSYPFALIKLFDPNFSEFKDKEIFVGDNKIEIIL